MQRTNRRIDPAGALDGCSSLDRLKANLRSSLLASLVIIRNKFYFNVGQSSSAMYASFTLFSWEI